MASRNACLIIVAVCGWFIMVGQSPVRDSVADPVPSAVAPEAPKPATKALRTIAVLEYKADWPEDAQQRKDTSEIMLTIVTDRLSSLSGVTVVERAALDKALAEQALALTGLTDAQRSVQVGRLAGVRFMITGRGFTSGNLVYVTTRITDVETGELKGIFATYPKNTDSGQIIESACDNLLAKLPATLNSMAPDEAPLPDPAQILKRHLGTAAASWTVAAIEEHYRSAPVVDPAIENELESLLTSAGQTVRTLGKDQARPAIDQGEKHLLDLSRQRRSDYCIVGQGFSEFGKRLSHDMVSCVARVELKIIDVKTGAVLAAGSTEARAVDLGEQLAAKQALRKGTRQLLLELAAKLPAASAEKPAPTAAPEPQP